MSKRKRTRRLFVILQQEIIPLPKKIKRMNPNESIDIPVKTLKL